MFATLPGTPITYSGLSLALQIAAMFSGGQQGAWYDESDFTTLSQDSAGATPVTVVEQPIGRMLDKSGRTNHAIQATAASRPVLSERINLLTKSEQFDDAAWAKIGMTVSANVIAAPDGTMTADSILTTSAGSAVGQLASTFGAGAPVTVSVYAKKFSSNFIRFELGGLVSCWFNLNTGVVASNNAGGGNVLFSSKSITDAGNGWYRCRLTVTTTVITSAQLNIFITDTDGASSSVSSSAYLWGAQAGIGSALDAYQRVNTATDYDTVGFPMFGKFDGVDDSMSSATGGGGTAGFFFCQAIKPLGGSGTVRTVWSDIGVNSGYAVQLNASNQLSLSAGNGTAFTTIATAAATAIGTTHLLTVWDDGTNLNVQLDSGTVATIARPVVTAGTAGFTIGKDNGAATGFFTGNFYPEIYRQVVPSAAERAQVQAYVRSKAGI